MEKGEAAISIFSVICQGIVFKMVFIYIHIKFANRAKFFCLTSGITFSIYQITANDKKTFLFVFRITLVSQKEEEMNQYSSERTLLFKYIY